MVGTFQVCRCPQIHYTAILGTAASKMFGMYSGQHSWTAAIDAIVDGANRLD